MELSLIIRFRDPFVRSCLWSTKLVVNVGLGDDATEKVIQDLAAREPKLRTFVSDWKLDNPEKKKGGLILSEQTGLALDACSHDWAIYLQADEVFHEQDYSQIHDAITERNCGAEGLLFRLSPFLWLV